MHSVTVLHSLRLGLLVAVLGLASCTESAPRPTALPPIVAGLAGPGLEARLRGLVLLGELGCANCHLEDSPRAQLDARRGPDLAQVGSRVLAEYLPRFLADPLAAEPGTTMPDLLRDRDDASRAAAADALACYLRSFSEAAPVAEAPDAAAAQHGRQLFHEIGCTACHAPRNVEGDELPLPGSAPLGDLTSKYSLQALRAFLLAPRDARPSARMPDLHLTPSEAHELGSFLLQRAPAPAALEAADDAPLPSVDAAKIAAGRALFAERGCAQCHRLDDPQRAPARSATPLHRLDPARGCMSDRTGPWPYYALADDQRADIVVALRALDQPLSDEQRILQRLAARNCTACHQRGEHGGPAGDRSRFFTTNDWNLGQDGRLPPPLSAVGAKLQRDWLVDSVAFGQSVRPYLRTRMPGFGKLLAAELADLFARVDSLPPLELGVLPEDREQAEVVIQLGRDLVGDAGMNCISCHLFAGERVGTMAAVDLVDSTAKRLRREWFVHYLRAPAKFRPGTLMPLFFVDGVSTRPQLGAGDAKRQIDAIWHFLAEGRNVRKPSGMRSPPMQLVVGEEALILRRNVQHTGKRGISVGYPGGVNLTFDAESLALNQIWWGMFVDAAGVWTGQGSGEARILGEQLARLPRGPAFAVLLDATAAWPAASRRELGQRFLGYDLDEKQRPVFRYVCEGVSIADAPAEMAAEGALGEMQRPILRRTLSFACEVDKALHFLAARDARVEDSGDGLVQVGQSLQLRLPSTSFRIRTAGAERELLVEIPIRQGRAELVIDYRWLEDSK